VTQHSRQGMVSVNSTVAGLVELSPKAEERKTDRENKRASEQESEKKGEASPDWVPKGGHPWPGSPSVQNAQLVSQASQC
jgi:hypothetical protein